MKIFATSDIHGNKVIADKLPVIAKNADLILICGDISGTAIRGKTFRQFSQYQREYAEYLTSILNSLAIPARFILGNDDWFDIEADNSCYLSKREYISDADLIPFEYVSITPFATNREVNENKLKYELHKISVDSSSIILAHTPPYGAGDILYDGSHCGSRAIKAWIYETQPLIWFCGHIHENNSVNEIGDTYIFNCACQHTDDLLRGWLVDTKNIADYKSIVI